MRVFDWPVYMGYVIRWEEALIGGVTLPGLLQSLWYEPGRIGLLDRLLVVVHGSHFLFFLFFGLAIWYLRPAHFGRYATALAVLMYAGLVGYILVPTVPPWMASGWFHVLPPINRIVGSVYNVVLPLQHAFDTNPIAAMPSLHAAFPTLCALVAIRHFRWTGSVLLGYVLLVWLAIVYLGEHYFVDVLVGAALAVCVYWVMYGTSLPGRCRTWLVRGRGRPSGATQQAEVPLLPGRTRVVVAVVLFVLSQGIGYASSRVREPFRPTRSFVERELVGKSDVGHFYLGLAAMDSRDYRAAEAAFARAVTEVPGLRMRLRTLELLGWTAFVGGNYATAAQALSELPPERLDDSRALMLGLAWLRSGRSAEGYRVLTDLVARSTSDPTPLYWLTRERFLDRQIGEEQVRVVVRRLRQAPSDGRAMKLALDLEQLVEDLAPRPPSD